MTTGVGGDAALRAPPLPRRMAAFAYEALLLFGLGLIPGLLGAFFVAQTGRQGVLQSDLALQAFGLIVYAIYFVWFWSERGQTLAMQTWRIGLIGENGSAPGQGRALARYLVCCGVWFATPALLASLAGLRPWPSLALLALWIVLYAASTLAAPGRQFWHDLLCGTRLVDLRGRALTQPATARPR